MRLKDRVAVITGGGSGIGRAVALAFAREGASVVVASRNLLNLENVVSEIRDEGGQATAIQTDITDEKHVQRMITQALNEYDKIDILINNAGIGGATDNVVDVTLEDWDKTFAVNLTGTMLCSREVLKSMVPRKQGSIVNISSNADKTGFIMRSPYCASKWGVVGFTLTLAAEVGIHNIRVNSISPGPTQGQRIDDIFKAKAEAMRLTYQDLYDNTAAKMALRRLVTPEEVAAAVIFFASDESSGITGQVLHVDAGFLLNLY